MSGDPATVKTDTIVTIQKEVRVDTVIKTVYTKPEVVKEYIKIPPGEIDTLAILKGYYTKRVFTDTVEDSCSRLIINDTVYMNSIISRELKNACFQKTITIKETKEIIKYPEEKPYISAGVSSSFKSVYGNVYYTRKKNTFGAGFDPINRSFIFSYQYKIRFNEKDSKN